MNIVLVQPEIPQNTGNIVRTCSLTNTVLHLVKPLGFSLSDRYLKRAGLDYWNQVEIKIYDSFKEFLGTVQTDSKIYLATTKAGSGYHRVQYNLDDYLVFGCETKGLPEEILTQFPDTQIRIPMLDTGRSLNLANSVAVILYEALRQVGFPGLK
ncbi:MAG: tRNA (uridine(34)/cytosine(34)/5-carboxymethylaminomethyluridine(34)-2'-O)-methyltransferase TrmL [Syntrophomonadaceae bacterium]|jgi:tRNA (cytidine/uridine-2'-O-)-methyltransferase|nr:tRNA (uridine(34)/cytosine(34)/5-carboxymethylaminomethyluridine(34)-2'-O)-methyltransferase TrmL [Syntrophomonadaceae bacterium]